MPFPRGVLWSLIQNIPQKVSYCLFFSTSLLLNFHRCRKGILTVSSRRTTSRRIESSRLKSIYLCLYRKIISICSFRRDILECYLGRSIEDQVKYDSIHTFEDLCCHAVHKNGFAYFLFQIWIWIIVNVVSYTTSLSFTYYFGLWFSCIFNFCPHFLHLIIL